MEGGADQGWCSKMTDHDPSFDNVQKLGFLYRGSLVPQPSYGIIALSQRLDRISVLTSDIFVLSSVTIQVY